MKIEFIPFYEDTHIIFSPPKPAVNSFPDWLKQMPSYLDGDKKAKIFKNGNVNGTVKACTPFTDSLMSGYTICLDTDIQVTIENGFHHFAWRTGRPMETHDSKQISAVQASSIYSPSPFKFLYEWIIKTPKNYSTLFTHPLNRTDLPFHTLSGVVDTDSYKLPTNFPFLIQKDFEGILEKGTPIVQAIPFKRDSWTSHLGVFSKEESAKAQHEFNSKIVRPYKTRFWTKKDYR